MKNTGTLLDCRGSNKDHKMLIIFREIVNAKLK
jgi:hypothetical protein